MIERELTLINRLGLHARAAAKLVNTAGAYRADVQLIMAGEAVNAKSILGLLLLAAEQGASFTVRCQGDDEVPALAAIETLIADRFGESS
jgi:phosphocarrier protein